MSKYKSHGCIGEFILEKRTCRGKEIAPLYAGKSYSFAHRVQTAIQEASAAGYLAFSVERACYNFADGEWKPVPWSTGKWGPGGQLRQEVTDVPRV